MVGRTGVVEAVAGVVLMARNFQKRKTKKVNVIKRQGSKKAAQTLAGKTKSNKKRR